ncbi:chloride channel protein [Aliidongia dinghuensis]|uniref:Chloride channel protein n=1 Tax=Aliidongia dinghuensis TaxID=1867774 RepID=A0A8J3E392_9PROT|nr:chloride channel protein [Aliidongia dinghuensis]GGF17203.1 chloride channel protein [Aliidongia dinghuensis]
MRPTSTAVPAGFFATRRRWLELRWRLLQRALTHSAFRDDELAFLGIAAVAGVLAALCVVVMRIIVTAIHVTAFQIPAGQPLSMGGVREWPLVLIVPVAGGLAVGAVTWAIRRKRPHEIVDAIEANALYGGRMSVRDSLNLALLSMLSSGVGASVGLEAAYTQIGSGLSSQLAEFLKLRRDDRRTLVGCGAAAAIAAAFNAPLAGAFFAFELILGSYTLAQLAPVTIAALAGTFVTRWVFGDDPVFTVSHGVHIHGWDYAVFLGLGLLSALVGIVVMRGATATEGWLRQHVPPAWLRPGIGAIPVGLLALVWPQVLGSGRGGIELDLHTALPLPFLIGLVLAKIAASAISIGAGFRGGLFSSALFIGSLMGGAIAMLIDRLVPAAVLDPLAYSLVGMGTVAAAIVGAPTAMILLVLEATGDFAATVGAMVGVVAASIAVRHWFGYSFATWRFHTRGLKIRSPEDVAWFDEIKVGRLMRSDPKTVPVDITIAALRRAYPLGSTKQVFAIEDGKLAGMIDLSEAYGPDLEGDPAVLTARGLVHDAPFLLPTDGLRQALAAFGESRLETLPVVNDRNARQTVGYLTEAYALRRYAQELERRRGESDGGSSLFGGTPSTP